MKSNNNDGSLFDPIGMTRSEDDEMSTGEADIMTSLISGVDDLIPEIAERTHSLFERFIEETPTDAIPMTVVMQFLDERIEGLAGSSEVAIRAEAYGIDNVPSDSKGRKDLIADLGAQVRESKTDIPLAVSLVTEAWVVMSEEPVSVTPSEHPDRQEVLVLETVSAGRVRELSYCTMERDADGNICGLGKPEVVESGRMKRDELTNSIAGYFFAGYAHKEPSGTTRLFGREHDDNPFNFMH